MPIADYAQTSIKLSSLLNDEQEEIQGPPALYTNPAVQIVFPWRALSTEVTYISFRRGFRVSWLNGDSTYRSEIFGVDDVQGRVMRRKFSDPAGFDQMMLHSSEHYYLKVCVTE